jgi:hypothetical protein
MAQLTQYSDLYPLILPYMPGYDVNIVLQAIKRTGRVFCDRTEAFREVQLPIPIVNFQEDYTLPKGNTSGGYDANVHRILWVRCNETLYDQYSYSLYEERILRFGNQYAPADMDSTLLKCGTCAKPLYTGWTGVTAGSVTFTIGSTTYSVEDLNFSSCTTMDMVAQVIQNGLSTESEDRRARVRYDAANARFLFWANPSTVSYLTAGVSGTDISGALYMNGLTGGTGVALSAMIETSLVFRPNHNSDTLPNWFFDRWAYGIAAGALASMMSMPTKPWSNPQLAAYWQRQYAGALSDAKSEITQEYRERSESIL